MTKNYVVVGQRKLLGRSLLLGIQIKINRFDFCKLALPYLAIAGDSNASSDFLNPEKHD